MKQERLFRLIQYIYLNGKTSAQTLSDELEVSPRTIYRDVDSLILSNVPILSTKGKNGGISLDSNYVIDRNYLNDSEQGSLLDLLYGFKTITGREDVLLEKCRLVNDVRPH
ncbi:HTH domain-containing protein [Erysipelothrix sp. HDW6A]|uniref:helix-turn-helix transcriptional regulator n=1 Tax=Erysipelothrix sp. HDW6A TaxID=2714928 RepID=UPI00140A97A1|nr:HTH domain-containing protein [Erysipelothrix sp. HDW6A]QIK57980.1 HTH domain-containing protein [Erysipelothrix sp. HDW6A]